MSQFYGALQGNRGSATRCGTKGSGMLTHCASWEGAVRCSAYYDEATKKDRVKVELVQWHGNGTSRVLYDGNINGED